MKNSPSASQKRSRFRTIQHVLNELCATYGFTTAVLVGPEGLPMAVADQDAYGDPDRLAAVAAHMRISMQTAQRQLGWSGLDEINIVSDDGHRLIGRPIQLDDEELILVILMPYWISYRKATTEAIGVIRWAWRSPPEA